MTDPVIVRRNYASAAINQTVRQGLQAHNDNFAFDPSAVPEDHGAGANIDSEATYLHEWYTEAATDGYLAEQAAQREEQASKLQNCANQREKSAPAADDNELDSNTAE
ncbi:hypothetical protein QP888_03405 [Corynebacterium sp. MSK297]|uniref:hypothetical protein n=1 Tax=Corynebacterium sp. MSK297 TaxID=3050221 RepID=UPI002551AF9E|nr:hypothetical protein [Corynebacterium sp. MSK297]MDK8845573.1 hypothetical protein [Corynebacterium sp. MSK297]